MEKFIKEIENVSKFVEKIICGAIKTGSTDIHFEPREDYFCIRYRIDGELVDVLKIENSFVNTIISRIKIISNMDITIKRIPQDGRLDFVFEGNKIDIRVASMPLINGEKIVMRLLNSSKLEIDIDNLGFFDEEKEVIGKVIKSPNGIIIVSGPTGSGKTTSLYSFIKLLVNEKTNIITLEDPVEIKMKGVNQVNINFSHGLDFATGLRAMLRQDFEVGLVGEMRDRETADIALRAGITGHLIFTTLHTSDTVSSIIRLLNLGIENYVISSGVVAVFSQRLVKKLCSHCKEEVSPNLSEIEIFKKYNLEIPKKIYKPCGCSKCNLGYNGRTLVFEYLILDDEFRELINNNCNSVNLYNLFDKKGNEKLYKNALRKVSNGITSFDEINKILFSLGDF